MLIDRDFFLLPTPEVARGLLGVTLLVRSRQGVAGGVIVETEAYLGSEDPAAHSYRGETVRTQSMFGPPGHAYVYFVYGMHTALNFVTGPVGTGHAVLIRALEPAVGVEIMQRRRNRTEITELCSGPGKLTQATGITLADNSADLLGSGRFSLEGGSATRPLIATDVRVGIKRAVDLPLRYYVKDSPFVSRVRKRPE